MRRKRVCKIIAVSLGVICLLAYCWPVIPAQAASATLYLAPSSGTKVIGSSFSVAVKVNTGGDVINAAEGTINFDNNLLDVTGVSKSGSIFPYWTTEPTFSNSAGTISFGGGLPPPAYSGTAGHVCTITFKGKKAGAAQVRFASGAVLAHDGKGTNILASMGSASFTISPYVAAPPQPAAPAEKPAEPAETEYNTPVITSPTHPDQNTWYNTNEVLFKWDMPEGVTEVSISFDQEPVSDPGPAGDGEFSEQKYPDVADGVWYLHLKFKDSRRWGTIAHYRVMIDTRPPLPFTVEVRQIKVGDWPELHFEAKDEGSGIGQYRAIVGRLDVAEVILSATTTIYKVHDLVAGDHTAMIVAVDKAGNETFTTVDFTVEAIEAPVIKDYPGELKSSDQLYLSGTALADTTINIFIQTPDGIIITGAAKSDNSGNWFYLSEDSFSNGRYVAWAVAVNERGIKSNTSNKVSFLVTPPVFARFGSWVINYFTVLVSLLFMIILIILLIFFLIGLIRKKLKKETVEIEQILRQNSIIMKKTIDQELAQLDKLAATAGKKKEIEKARLKLKQQVEINEKKILKEIKDVEEILK